MIAIDYDPLALDYVKSLARPGGNVTGVFFQQIELAVKRAQLLKDAFPDPQAATVFWDAISADQWRATQSAAEALGLRVAGIELRETPYDYERAFAQSPLDYRGELLVMVSPFFFRDRAQHADLVLRHRWVPCSVHANGSMQVDCCLMGQASQGSTDALPSSWIGSPRGPSPLICRSINQPSSG
jgi:hypothetical protein